ncbi:metallophosphoesterase [Alkalihalophilus sp. As8PL]|uniref:Metallophosphoesterase n=1 Tax=Alkalihalophilus sp. As8PL TaxID=3237103 RepID=A0AB39BZ11_9BACI
MIVLYLVFGIGLILLSYMYVEAFRNRLRIHKLSYDTLPQAFDAFRVFFISDLHRRKLSPKLLDQMDHKCDLVIIGGDLVERGVSIDRYNENLRLLTQLGPTYFVWGNNDMEVDQATFEDSLSSHGVVVLSNSSDYFEVKDEQIRIIGLEENWEDSAINENMSGEEKQDFTILVSHYPDVIREAQEILFPHLSLSGHTHGGQIRFLGFGIAEKGGLKKEKGSWHLISNGYGTTSLPLRLCAPAEAHMIVLKRR